ncbi:hypothetical protein B0H14DRAFT_3507535 [Mycena olivaceomarginata]|nr:hypothetical protein B0H14DRAFT_3507535 [Mycena olivaceomarginata]
MPWACLLHETDNAEDALHRLEIPPISSDAKPNLEEDEPDVGPLICARGARAQGKGDTEGDEELWYDQKLKRKLIFSDLPALPRVLEHVDEEFGRPVPGWAFGARKHRDWAGAVPSVWMYRREKASRHRVGERYSPPTPLLRSPQLEESALKGATAEGTLATTAPRDTSPSEGSVVSLGPEEDAKMVDVETRETTETERLPEPMDEDVITYVLIHGHSFSFGIGDLWLWLCHLGSEIESTSIMGIYRLLQADYRVDYLFEVRNSRDAELLLRAGERNTRSAGARYMSRDRFERAIMGQHRFGLDASPPPENLGKTSVEPQQHPNRTRRHEDERTLLSGDQPTFEELFRCQITTTVNLVEESGISLAHTPVLRLLEFGDTPIPHLLSPDNACEG